MHIEDIRLLALDIARETTLPMQKRWQYIKQIENYLLSGVTPYDNVNNVENETESEPDQV